MSELDNQTPTSFGTIVSILPDSQLQYNHLLSFKQILVLKTWLELYFSGSISTLLETWNPFADAIADNSDAGSKEYVHIRIQQRNGRKSLTTVQGLKKEFSYNKILKDLKKEFCCNGNVHTDPELGQVIQLQGDQRKNVSTFLVQQGVVKKEQIKIHGF
ncbi:hypothetical protein OROMI_023300 [Orobanche minor]